MTETSRVALVIDDEPQVRRFLRAGLELDGFSVLEAGDATQGLREATLRRLDLVIVDLGLPDHDGSLVVERLREWSAVPILVLSVNGREAEKVRLLELGADDYVVKPFGMGELLARARAALRRAARGDAPQPLVSIGDFSIDLTRRNVSRDGRHIPLTPKEYRLVQALARHCGKVVTHQHLLNDVWGRGHAEDQHYLRILVRKVRQKIEPDPTQPRLLLTELGVGYRLANPTEKPSGE